MQRNNVQYKEDYTFCCKTLIVTFIDFMKSMKNYWCLRVKTVSELNLSNMKLAILVVSNSSYWLIKTVMLISSDVHVNTLDIGISSISKLCLICVNFQFFFNIKNHYIIRSPKIANFKIFYYYTFRSKRERIKNNNNVQYHKGRPDYG